MKDKKLKLITSLKGITNSLSKHKVILGTTFLAALFLIINVYYEDSLLKGEENYINEIGLSLLFGGFVSVSLEFLTEKLTCFKKYLIRIISVLVSSGVVFLMMHFVEQDSYKLMYYLGAIFIVVTLTVYFLIPKENSESYFANIFKDLLFCGLISLVGFLGTTLLFYAFSNLILEIDDFEKLVISLALIFFEFFYINIYVYYLFEKRNEPSGKAFKIIFMYILLPVYVILLLILYIYLLKAVFTFSLPQGQINIFVSLATAFFLLLNYVLKEYKDNKVMKLFYSIGAVSLLPLIIIQFTAFFIRVNAYGFTGWRYSSLLYNIFATVFIVLSLFKNDKIMKLAVPVLTSLIFVAAFTPFNIINLAYNSQYSRMIEVLEKYEMFNGNEMIKYNPSEIDNTMTDDDRNQLVQAWKYIAHKSEHPCPEWIDKNKNFKELFKIESLIKDSNIKVITHFSEGKPVDISGYKTMEEKNLYFFSERSNRKEKIIIDSIGFDISEQILSFNSKNTSDFVIEIDENHKIVITDLNVEYDISEKNFVYYSINFYLLTR